MYFKIILKVTKKQASTLSIEDTFFKKPQGWAQFDPLRQIRVKDDLIEYKCLCCNKNYQQEFDEKLKEQFFNTHKFSNHDNNKFILLLQKGVYTYEYMRDWEKCNETSLPEKEDFYSYLNVENITDAD